MKNNLTVTRGEVGGDNRGKGRKGFQEQLYRTHGQNQGGMEAGEGGGDGWVGQEVVEVKCRQLKQQ